MVGATGFHTVTYCLICLELSKVNFCESGLFQAKINRPGLGIRRSESDFR